MLSYCVILIQFVIILCLLMRQGHSGGCSREQARRSEVNLTENKPVVAGRAAIIGASHN